MGARRKQVDPLGPFKTWLSERGAIIEAPTSEWEVLRVRTDMGTHVVHVNKKGVQTWPDEARRLYECFEKNMKPALSPDRSYRRRVRGMAAMIGRRDGFERWFCARLFDGAEDDAITTEHLVSHSHGGPDHIANLVLACEPCNAAAGTLSVSEKVRLRERKRGILYGHVPNAMGVTHA